jgi:uncharacterized protein (TIGR03067 family)
VRIPWWSMLAVAALSAGNKISEDKTDMDLIQGTWTVVSIISGGQPLPSEVYQGVNVSIAGAKVTTTIKGRSSESTFELDPSKDPREFTLATGEQVDLGLYELKRDDLKIGFPDTGRERPKDLTGNKASNCLLITLRRDKP